MLLYIFPVAQLQYWGRAFDWPISYCHCCQRLATGHVSRYFDARHRCTRYCDISIAHSHFSELSSHWRALRCTLLQRKWHCITTDREQRSGGESCVLGLQALQHGRFVESGNLAYTIISRTKGRSKVQPLCFRVKLN